MRIWLDMMKSVNKSDRVSILNVKHEVAKDVHAAMTELIRLGYKVNADGKFLTVEW